MWKTKTPFSLRHGLPPPRSLLRFFLVDGMLRRRWIRLTGVAIRNRRTVTERPNSRPVRNFEIFVRHDAAPILLAGKHSDKRIRRSSSRPDQRLSCNARAVAQVHRMVVHSDYLRLQNLHLAFGELFLRVFTQLRPKFWKNNFSRMDQDYSNPIS